MPTATVVPSPDSTDTPAGGDGTEGSPPPAGIKFAGLALQAADTGRVLMLQRALDPTEQDPNHGLWEFPGGALEPGEDPYAGALREFQEEAGFEVPADADNGGASWDLPPDAPKYRLHLLTIPAESEVNIEEHQGGNPDDPSGDHVEAMAWWDPAHITGDNIRPEVLDAMQTIDLNTEDDAMTKTSAAPPPVKKAPVQPAPADGTPTDAGAGDDLVTTAEKLLSEADPETVQKVLALLQDAAPGEKPMPEDAMVASVAPVAPPDEWFEPFDLDGPTPLTITAEGRVFGHLATWDSCHRGGQYANKCTPPPHDPNAPYFHLGEIITASGNSVDVGVITVGGGHYTEDGVMTTLEHHDDVTAAGAAVIVREDATGIGVFGSVVPGATPEMVASMRRSPISGAWRKEKGKFRLAGIHAVNNPGHPIPRTMVASVSNNAFVVMGRVEPKQPEIDLRSVVQRLAKGVGLDTESMVASARSRMSGLDCGCDDEEGD